VRLRGTGFLEQGGKAGSYRSQGVRYNQLPVYRQASGENFLFWLGEEGWQGWVIGQNKTSKNGSKMLSSHYWLIFLISFDDLSVFRGACAIPEGTPLRFYFPVI
jgi:hypothetical protein